MLWCYNIWQRHWNRNRLGLDNYLRTRGILSCSFAILWREGLPALPARWQRDYFRLDKAYRCSLHHRPYSLGSDFPFPVHFLQNHLLECGEWSRLLRFSLFWKRNYHILRYGLRNYGRMSHYLVLYCYPAHLMPEWRTVDGLCLDIRSRRWAPCRIFPRVFGYILLLGPLAVLLWSRIYNYRLGWSYWSQWLG